MKNYKKIAMLLNQRVNLQDSIKRCNENKDHWVEVLNNCEIEIDNFCNAYNHSGMEIEIDINESSESKIVLNCSYHVMDEHGYYDGYFHFIAVITPHLSFDIKLKLKGKFSGYYKKYYLRDYIFDTIYYFLDHNYEK